MTLPGGGTWTYSYVTDFTAHGDYAHGSTAANLPDEHNLDKYQLMLARVTDDQGRVIDYTLSDAGVVMSAQTNQAFDTSGNLFSSCLTQYGYKTDSSGTNPFYLLVHSSSAPPSSLLIGMKTTFSQATSPGHTGFTRVLSQNTYTYDDSLNRRTNTVSIQPLDAGGHPAMDGSGNPVLNSRTEAYAYDALNRLSTVDYGDGQTQSYTFDAMGNRLSRADSASGTTTSAYDAANRLLSTGGAGASGFQNDADGNTLTGGARTEAWDSQNRLASCTKSSPAGGGGTATFYGAYAYGADGLRRRATTYSVTRSPGQFTPAPPSPLVTDYAYDGTMLVREGSVNTRFGQSGLTPSNITATYFQGASGPCYRRDDTQSELDSQGRTVTKARWYVYDGLGSVAGEVDPLGNLTSSPKYDVYGATRSNGGVASSKQGFVGSLGHVSDDTGLVYMRARYYDPSAGRFVSEDSKKDGVNWFCYCDNSPNNETDTSGDAPSLKIVWRELLDYGSKALLTVLDHHYGLDNGTAEAIRKEIAAEIKSDFRRFRYGVGKMREGQAKEEETDGVDVTEEVSAGVGLEDEAQNVANAIEDLSVLDYAEGTEGMDGEGI